jgi:hypothetical protein
MTTRSYSELQQIETFEERYEYLRLGGTLGTSTFGFDRYLNQRFYTSVAWKRMREFIVTRDFGCDLGVHGHDIPGRFLVHHMNPLTIDDVNEENPENLNPEYLITTTHDTHNAIHYGDASLLPQDFVERYAGDTKLW